ncbi:hypothetical protein [Ruminococcus difficilis]|uniref:Uncharacterized protein n=1 Tax=Ruminococcus difficilis TaxID=2763069 RepID=A0A934U2F2_9FIRM|nr:hypothetical protein [Ruminococcus difficilis]MBK6088214.1 hypothetical protein [Ruminococcus difficilis]
MKRVFILLAAVLMTALAVFAVNTSAAVTDSSLIGVSSRSNAITAKVGDSEAVSSTIVDRLLDVQPPTEYDADEIKEDGINTRVATVWIVSISAICFIAIMILTVKLAKKNQGHK